MSLGTRSTVFLVLVMAAVGAIAFYMRYGASTPKPQAGQGSSTSQPAASPPTTKPQAAPEQAAPAHARVTQSEAAEEEGIGERAATRATRSRRAEGEPAQPTFSPAEPVARAPGAVQSGQSQSGQMVAEAATPALPAEQNQAAVAPNPMPQTATQGQAGPGIAPAPNSSQPVQVQGEAPPASAAKPAEVAEAAVPKSSDSAMLHASGKVLINGTPANDIAIFPGQTIETPAGTVATITRPGSVITVQPGSIAEYSGKAAILRRGGVAVTTTDGMSVQAGDVTVSPSAPKGRYEVMEDGEGVHIAANDGSVLINDHGQTALLAEGQQTSRGTKTTEAAGGGDGHGISKKKLAFILLGAGGGAATAAVVLTRDRTAVSPSVP